ncbi:hypothetical protein PIROE2DRAFT_12960 [Piromyces sp. E2]|nr:hypothetical protein PIROE2DRAFT_12960 [Piromyces sp. E2]|eukprot:OUM61123.1 hypothetical protein PIROE2DRAFT_12960 [Piromyces sp. E2]
MLLMLIHCELFSDVDLFFSSFYLDVDFAPWDFDSGFGNKDVCLNGGGFFAGKLIPDTTVSDAQTYEEIFALNTERWNDDVRRDRKKQCITEDDSSACISESIEARVDFINNY